jgi:hypothetical protein
MYLTAMHLQTKGGAAVDGINVYYYAHDVEDWQEPPDPEVDCGRLVKQIHEITPGGNRVRSYIDIVAPAGTSWQSIRNAFVSFITDHDSGPMPWNGTVGCIRFGVAVERSLATVWTQELSHLLVHLLKLPQVRMK